GLPATEPEAAAGRLVDRAGRALDELDRRLVALAPRLPPRDQAVLLQKDRARRRLPFEQQRDPPRHVEAGALIVEPDDLVAEVLLCELPAARRRRQRDHRIRV